MNSANRGDQTVPSWLTPLPVDFGGEPPMEIELVYQTWDGTEPVRLMLSPADYFDPLEPGETYESHGIPRYNHTWQYLHVPRSRLKWSKERRQGTGEDSTFRTQYMDGGRSWMNHRLDPDGYEEIIHHTELTDGCYHIIRTCRKTNGAWVVALNSVVSDLADGTQREQRFDQPWSPEEMIS
jgi:hypothetical protein